VPAAGPGQGTSSASVSAHLPRLVESQRITPKLLCRRSALALLTVVQALDRAPTPPPICRSGRNNLRPTDIHHLFDSGTPRRRRRGATSSIRPGPLSSRHAQASGIFFQIFRRVWPGIGIMSSSLASSQASASLAGRAFSFLWQMAFATADNDRGSSGIFLLRKRGEFRRISSAQNPRAVDLAGEKAAGQGGL